MPAYYPTLPVLIAFVEVSLNDRCTLGEATFAGMGGKEEHAPIPVIPTTI